MKAVILAGGLGTRLQPFTQVIPKPLLPIGESSVLEIQVLSLARFGFTDIFVATNYMRQDLSWINGGAIGTVHINLFHKSSLERLLSRVGLEIVGVDGEYGFNSYELASYFLGGHRGAWDYARGARVEQNLSEETICFLNWVGPAWIVLARQLLLTPIIKVIATKSRNADVLARFRSSYGRARRDEVIAELDRSYPQP